LVLPGVRVALDEADSLCELGEPLGELGEPLGELGEDDFFIKK
jgi:hypothetical protein